MLRELVSNAKFIILPQGNNCLCMCVRVCVCVERIVRMEINWGNICKKRLKRKQVSKLAKKHSPQKKWRPCLLQKSRRRLVFYEYMLIALALALSGYDSDVINSCFYVGRSWLDAWYWVIKIRPFDRCIDILVKCYIDSIKNMYLCKARLLIVL